MGVDTTVLSGLEKDFFEKGVSEGVNNNFPLKDFFKQETTDADYIGGAGHIWTHHTGRNVSPMFTREGAAFAAAGAQRHIKGRIDIRKMMARLYMTAEAMEFYSRSEASYANAMSDEKTRLVDDISWREEANLGSDGRGVLALLSDDPGTGTDVDVDSPGNIPGTSFGNRFIQRDMYVGAVNPATGSLRAGIVKVAAVNEDGSDFTADAAVNAAWADNDYIVQAANASVTSVLDTSYEAAYWGLAALIDDGTYRENYFGINRSDAPSLKSYVVANAGAFSLDLAQRTSDVVNQKLGGAIDTLVMHHSVRREYIKLLQADRRYSGGDLQNPNGGTKAMTQGDLGLGECTVKAIRSIGLAQVYFLDTKKSKFKTYVGNAGQFEERGGGIWVRDGSGNSARHAFEAWWYAWKQNFCENPGFNARWDGVTGQTLVVVRSE
jgi:hypothetical protein